MSEPIGPATCSDVLFPEGEADPAPTIRKFRMVQAEGKAEDSDE